MTAVGIPSIQVFVMNCTPHIAQQLGNQIANRLPEKPKTAGVGSAYFTQSPEIVYHDEVLYSLGNNYREAAK